MLDLFSLAGKTAAVTGTSRGIGRVFANALAEAGADIVHLNRKPSDDAEADIVRRGRKTATVPCDLTQSAGDLQRVIDRAHAWSGHLDILVNNAGVLVRKPVLEQSADEIAEVVQVDLMAPIHLSTAAARYMTQAGGGKIVNVASLMSFQGGLNTASYVAAKSGLAGATRAMANEWGSSGVRVNAIVPGYIATEFNADLRADTTRTAEFKARIPVGRWGNPDDLVGGLIFLASRASEYVTGHMLVIDGGWMSR
jgi:2-deoxy-D-gluconate 3-dehydrogenase